MVAATGAAYAVLFGIAWDPPPEAKDMYLEYVIVGDRNPQVITNQPRNAHTVVFCGTNTNLLVRAPMEPGSWFYVAYSVWSNTVWSEPSNMVEVRVPSAPTNAVRVAVDVSPDMSLWTNSGFIRMRIQ